MNAYKDYLAAIRLGMNIITQAAGVSFNQMLADGASHETARKLSQLVKVYTGKTTNTAKRAQAIQHALDNQLTLDAIELIEKYAGRASDANKAWDVRLELTQLTTTLAIKSKGRELTQQAPVDPEAGIKITRRDGRNWSMNITAPSDVISKLEQVGKTPEALQEALTKGGLRETIVTNVIVTPTDLEAIEAGRGDEVRVHSTDGAWRTGAQLSQKLSAEALDSLRVILQTPAGIGINTYRLAPRGGCRRRRHRPPRQQEAAADGLGGIAHLRDEGV